MELESGRGPATDAIRSSMLVKGRYRTVMSHHGGIPCTVITLVQQNYTKVRRERSAGLSVHNTVVAKTLLS